MINYEEIENLVQQVFHDIKAEAVIADLIENGLKPDDFLVENTGLFKRRYARDIDKVENKKLENFQNLIGFYLNRDGIYDSLPEGLFHNKSGNEINTKKRFSEDSVELKQEEKEARRFFLPFENEIFYQRVQLELEERKILSRFSERIFNDIYPELWNLHHSIGREYVYRMVLMLHMAHKIAGNIELTAKCLQSILNEKVEITKSQQVVLHSFGQKSLNYNSEASLGKGSLGNDMVCGDGVKLYEVKLFFIIGPLQNSQAKDYLLMAPLSQFLTCFYNFFVPIEFDIETKILVDKDELNFGLEENSGPILGYETAI